MSEAVTATPGLPVRLLAAALLRDVLDGGKQLDEAMTGERGVAQLEPRDRAFLHTLLLNALRRKGEIDTVLAGFLEKPLPRKAGLTKYILSVGAAQLLFLDVAPHAAIDLAVRSAKADRDAMHFTGLVNAILRKLANGGAEMLKDVDAARVSTPPWMLQRWGHHYGKGHARRIALAHLAEPPTDVFAKSDAAVWASRLNGTLLPTGSIRLADGHAPLTELPGFAEGAWWVQDAAAAIPVLLFGNLAGKSALDLCAAPGGKTMQLCAQGAAVTAVDVSKKRLARLERNLSRIGLTARIVASSVQKLDIDEIFDAVLLDAPCSATGTIRRHPELPWLRSETQIAEPVEVQRSLLAAAARYVAPGGLLVYSTCSLEPEEGEQQADWFLAQHPSFTTAVPQLDGLPGDSISADGWIRLLPFMQLGSATGLDGFFIAGFRRAA